MSLFVINRSLNDVVSDSENIALNVMNINSIINCYGYRKAAMVYSEIIAAFYMSD